MKVLKYLPLLFLFIVFGCLDSSSTTFDDSEDLAFLEEYAQRSGVTTTSSGLMYRVIEEGKGETPAANQHSIISYQGESVNKQVQFGTGDNFEIIRPDEMTIFKGLGEAVQVMREGARYEFVMPSELAQGDGRVFIFDLTLESFLREDQNEFMDKNAELEDIMVTDTGLQYRIIEEGDGRSPGPSSVVRVKFTGTYTNGFIFDKSTDGNGVEFNVSGVIAGFGEGLQLMEEGAKYELFLPPSLGYGRNRPQYGTVLKFEVELLEVI